jgi:NTE family protein
MKANIVLAGGGVKGSVLGGCIMAAEDHKVEPVGFGGTSAGSIVAMLASVGYQGSELRDVLIDTDLTTLLDDDGSRLEELRRKWELLIKRLKARSLKSLWSLSRVQKSFGQQIGLYEGARLKEFLAEKISEKVADLPVPASEVTFSQLVACGCKPLRVVATDLLRKRAVVFGDGRKGQNHPVVEAVFASACFPFVFKPVWLDDMLLTDGGLSSNLPSFLFEQEYRESRTRTLAFDLLDPSVQDVDNNAPPENMAPFVESLLGSAMEASDVLLRHATPGVEYFPITTPEGIGTLDFSLSQEKRAACFDRGNQQASHQLSEFEPVTRSLCFGEVLQERMVSRFGPVRSYQPVLRALIQQLEIVSPGQVDNARAHIMLLTGRDTRIVTYSLGMEKDPDADLELDQVGGCSGKAWETRDVAVANLEEARRSPEKWNMTQMQHRRVPARLKSMISVAIPGNVHAESAPDSPIGTLSLDCETPLADTGWCTDAHARGAANAGSPDAVDHNVLNVLRAWAGVVGAMLP